MTPAKNLVTVRAVKSRKIPGIKSGKWEREKIQKKLMKKLRLEGVKSNGRKLKHGTVKDKL